jgi:hypothetical protein
MKKWIINTALAALVAAPVLAPHFAWAEEDEITKEEVASEKVKNRPEWSDALKTQHKLTDEQIQTMKSKGLTYPQMAMVSSLSEKSGKSIDDVLKMRTEDKMGWGKIAKELGVPPKEIGQSVASLRHEIRDEKRAEKQEKRDERMARKEAKRAEKAEGKKH